MIGKPVAAIFLVGLALGIGARAQAAVVFSCTVSAGGINFGVYNPLSATGDSAAGSWTVICTATGTGSATVSGTLSLSRGNSGSYASRSLRFGANTLSYNIYLLPNFTQVLGDGTGGTVAPSDSGTVTAGQIYQVNGNMYGLIPALQDVPAGGYSDSIVVTVTY
jgi:spore coat protein U-like protein